MSLPGGPVERVAASPGRAHLRGSHPRTHRARGAWPPAEPARARAALTSQPHPRTLHREVFTFEKWWRLQSGPGPCAAEDMEFVSGYRDEFLDFTALLFGWFRKFVAERGAVGTSLEGRCRQLEAQIRRLPQDPALWVLHVLPNHSVGISLGQGAEPGPGPGLGTAWLLGDNPPLHLRDLSPYISFVSLEDGEEGEEEEEEDEEEEKREDGGAGSTEKVEPEEDRELAPTSRESPQETNPPGESEEAAREAGGGKDGCREDRVENETRPQKRKGQRSEVTSETFNKEAFLASRGLTRGYWTQLSMLIPGPGFSRHPRGNTPSLSLLRGGDPYQLLQGDGTALMPPVPPHPPRGVFGSWQDYYTWRGLSLDSPIAVLLTYPLTVYYVITHLVPQSFPELNIQNKQSLKIHVVEAGKEFDLVMVFWELLVLLPHVALELQFVGDGLPPESDEQHFTLQRDSLEVSVRPGSGISARPSSGTKEKGGRRDLQIKVSARPYHLFQGPKPDLVIGFNSGFALKDTWLRSLPRLQSLRVPAFFTESSEYSCVMDGQTMAVATGGGTSPPQPNPFRSPFRLRAADNCMSWYCNAFIFHLVYKPAQGSGARPAPGPPPPSPTPSAPPAPTRRRRGEKKPGRGARRRK
ncbi:zinc finger MYND domain-containing protein 15 isoform X3 [Homo sapiens]|uniref:zinc finger MYND domain-containing protein 15 isoform X3 n=1 Tax=Homo sapiens TaxID=9606 RepID=UPI001FB0DE15|nr:zinc finger MYND domain-containing protein 15 isoform X3 [Homo sapiens]XP_054173518.1 zinc finger MYND domain-containing protein 15 isoform X3 [Homo sapiens]